MSLDTLSKAIGDTIDLSVGDIIAKYGNKKAIGIAAQKGEIDPTKAAMAGMAIDRVIASAAQPTDTTVVQDIFGAPQTQAGIGAMTPQVPTPQMGRPQMPQRPGQGLNQVPVSPQMFAQRPGMAGGGIVAFQPGGAVSGLQNILSQMSMQELEYYRRTGRLPEKYRMMLPGAEPTFNKALQERGLPTSSIGAPMAPTPSTTPRLTFGEPASFVGVSPEQVDPFSATQVSDKYVTDVGYVPPAGTPEAAPSSGLTALTARPPAAPPPDAGIASAATAQRPPSPEDIQKIQVKAETEGLPFDQAFNKYFAEEQAILGTDPRIAARKAAYEKAAKRDFTDRLMENALLFQAGEKMRRGVLPGQKTGEAELADVMARRGEKRKEALALEKEKADIEGLEYQRKAESLGRFRTRQEKKEDVKTSQDFQERLKRMELSAADQRLVKSIQSQLEIANLSLDKKGDIEKIIERMAKDPEFAKGVQLYAQAMGKGDALAAYLAGRENKGADIRGVLESKFGKLPN